MYPQIVAALVKEVQFLRQVLKDNGIKYEESDRDEDSGLEYIDRRIQC